MFTTQRRPMVLLAAGTLLTAFGTAGCSNSTPDNPPTTVVTTAPAPAAAPGGAATAPATPNGPDTKINVNAGPGTSEGTDQATGEAVNKAIVTNKEMTGARIEAVVTGGVATLTGSAQDAQQKALAEKAARDTTGVSSVKNKIQINPTGGAKAASAPPATKIIVVHDKPAPAAPAAPATPSAPGGSTGDGTGTPPDSTAGAPSSDNGGGSGAAAPPAAAPGQ